MDALYRNTGLVMEKARTINSDRRILPADDAVNNGDLKHQALQLNHKVQQMLTWSSLCSVWSYLVLIVVIARLYHSFKGPHTLLLVASLLAMYTLMGILIYLTWKGMMCKHTEFQNSSIPFLKKQIGKLSRQRKLTACYLLEYALLMAVASIFFFLDIKNGLTLILKVTIPVSMITYTLGIYFIGRFTSQMRKLEVIDRQLAQLLPEKNFNLN